MTIKQDARGVTLDYHPGRGWSNPRPLHFLTEDERAACGGTFAPNAQVIASHIREQTGLNIFKKENA